MSEEKKPAMPAEWMRWSPGDALPEGHLFWCCINDAMRSHTHVEPAHFGFRRVIAYWSVPMPPPYQESDK